MKTLRNTSAKKNLIVSLAAAILLLASCKKESVLPQTKSGNVITYGNDRQIAEVSVSEASTAAALAVKQAVDMIKIDHIAARTHAPDYCVTVKFDGTIVFEGRRNVAYIGTRQWKLEMNKFYAVKQLFAHSGFNSIEDNLSLLADVPMISTTWCASPVSISKTLIDYNDAYPEGLISLREKAEAILDLSLLVNSDVKVIATIKDAAQ